MPQLIRVVERNGKTTNYSCDRIVKSARHPDGGIDVTLVLDTKGESSVTVELRPLDGRRVFQMVPDGIGGLTTSDRIKAYDSPEEWGPNGPPPKYAAAVAAATNRRNEPATHDTPSEKAAGESPTRDHAAT